MHHFATIDIGGFTIDIATWLATIVTCIVVFVLARLSVRNLSVDNPGKMQQFLEWVVDFVKGLISSTMDYKKGKAFLVLGLTLIMFIFVANMLGLPLTIITDHTEPLTILGFDIVTQEMIDEAIAEGGHSYHLAWWKSPTADVSVSLGLAALVFILVHSLGAMKNTRAYFKHYVQPSPLFLPINILEQFTKLATHGMRLYGNIFAGEVLIGVLLGAAWFIGIPGLIVWQGFSMFIGAIQAFIFTILTMVYISQALESHEEHH